MFRVWKERFDMEEDYFTKSNLSRFSLTTLNTLIKEMKSEVQRISQHLVHSLVEKDKVVKRTDEMINRVSELLAKYALANGQKTNFKFYLKFTNYYDNSEYRKWRRSWSIVLQLEKGINKEWRKGVWEGVVMHSTRDISWDRVLHHLSHGKANSREQEWKKGVEMALIQLGALSIDKQSLDRVLVCYSRIFPQSVFCPEFVVLAAVALAVSNDEKLTLQVLVTLLEHKLPPHYFADEFQSVKSDVLVLEDLIKHFLPQLSSHMQFLRTSSYTKGSLKGHYSSADLPTHSECTAFEPPLVNSLSLQWFLLCFTNCLPFKIIKRIFSAFLLEGSEMLLYTALAIWMLMESELLKVKTVPDFYQKASDIIAELKCGTYIAPKDFIQIVYTLKQCAKKDANVSIKKLRKKHTDSTEQRFTPICPPPSQGGSLAVPPVYPPPISPSPQDITEITPITAKAECPQTKRSGFVFSHAYAADVPIDLPVKYSLRISKNCTKLLKSGQVFNMGADYETNNSVHFSASQKYN